METQNAHELQRAALYKEQSECVDKYGIGALSNTTKSFYNESGWFCPAYWDGILCWPITKENTLAKMHCPSYVVGFDNPMNNASRRCMDDGTWYYLSDLNKFWTNYSQCFESEQATIFVELPKDISKINDSLIVNYVSLLKTIPRVGYTISLCTLLVAFTIMFSIKKLHCPRNNLHMNLFASFIFRAFILLLKDLIFVKGIGFASEIKIKDGNTFFYENTESNNWSCKLFTTLCEFFITANYSWILMEGLYLHNLIFRALFADSSGSITPYIILGWGLPMLVIIPWIITRLLIENTYCWTTHDDVRKTFLIIRIPTMISIIINTILFIRIIKVLFSKLRSTQSEEAKRYQKWAKSTLVLMPLFGIHYAAFLGMSYSFGKGEIVELIWLICDQLFASFQGFFVAMLYCFLNGEVQKELKPYINGFCNYIARRLCCCSTCCKCCTGDDFGTIKSRSSVCTMMSNTSLYNGVNHHRHKTRWDCHHHTKHPILLDKTKDHVCPQNVRSWHDISPRKVFKQLPGSYSPIRSKKYEKQFSHSNGSIHDTDVNICINCQNAQERCKSEPHIEIEMKSMLHAEQ